MKLKPTPPPLIILIALLASVLLPQAALTQRRGIGMSQTLAEGRYYALVIGNDDYVSLPKLKTAVADARKVESVLREFYGFQIRLLLNATRAQVAAALSSYSHELTADDTAEPTSVTGEHA
jgi:Caspase domain